LRKVAFLKHPESIKLATLCSHTCRYSCNVAWNLESSILLQHSFSKVKRERQF